MTRQLADEQSLINALATGLTDRQRPAFWQQCIERRIGRPLNMDLYATALKSFYPSSTEVPAFFPIVPDFGSPLYFDAPDSLRPLTPVLHSQRHILCLLANSFPKVTFCPMLPDLVMLLLEHVNEKTTYVFLAEMLTISIAVQPVILSYTPPAPFFYFTIDTNAHLSCVKRFYLLLKSEQSALKHHLKHMGIDIVDMFKHWLERFFTTYFPPHTLFHFLDGFMLFGLPFFYSTILSLFSVHRNAMLKMSRAIEPMDRYVHEVVASTPREVFMPNAIEGMPRRLRIWEKIRAKDVKNYSLGSYPHAREILAHVPVFSSPSDLLSIHTLCALWCWLEAPLRLRNPRLLYSSARHGYSLSTMLQVSSDINKPTFTILQSSTRAIFGVFLMNGWVRETQSNNNSNDMFRIPTVGAGQHKKDANDVRQKITPIDGRSFIFTLVPEMVCYRLPEARKARDKLFVEQFSADTVRKSLAATRNGIYHSLPRKSVSATSSPSLFSGLLRGNKSPPPTVPSSPSHKPPTTSTLRAWTDLVGGNSVLSGSSLRNSLTSRDTGDTKDAIEAALPLSARFDVDAPPNNDYLHNFALHLRQMVDEGTVDDDEISTAHMICSDEYIAIGDAVGVAFSLDRLLRNGVSQRTLCFKNKNMSMSGSVDGAFECIGAEVWCID
jgi:hypothetical protein